MGLFCGFYQVRDFSLNGSDDAVFNRNENPVLKL